MAFQHLRSSTASKRPTPAAMSDGQLAINTNTASPGLFFKDSAGALIKVGPVHVGSTAPNASPATGGQTGNTVGEQWLDTSGTYPVFKIWDGSAWQSEAGEFVNTNGDTMTGALILPNGSEAAPALGVGSTDNGIYSPGADQVAISTNGTGRISINADGDVDIDSGGVFYDATNDRLGIGTTSPGTLIDGASSGVNAELRLTRTDAATAGSLTVGAGNTTNNIYSTGVKDLTFSTNTQERARIDSSGRLLVGTSSTRAIEPYRNTTAGVVSQILFENTNAALSIVSTDNSTASFGASLYLARTRGSLNQAVVSGDSLGGISFAGGDGTDIRTRGASIDCEVDGTPGANDMPGRLVFSTTADGASSPTERLRIDSSGRLLVGTSSASGTNTLFESSSTTANAANVALVKRNSGTADQAGQQLHFYNFGPAGTARAADTEVGSMRFYGSQPTSGAAQEMARITCAADLLQTGLNTSGRLVFSTTADGASSPTERLRITSSGQLRTLAAQTALQVSSATGAGTSQYLIGGNYGATTTGGGTNSFRVYTNGNVQNTNNSYDAISDSKLKENIVDAGSQWSDIKSLQVRNYNFKGETGHQTHTQIGLIAQELELTSPGLVTTSPDLDDEGNDLGTVTKGVKYSVLYMKAVKALQEAMERIETLEASNTDLLARVAALESA